MRPFDAVRFLFVALSLFGCDNHAQHSASAAESSATKAPPPPLATVAEPPRPAPADITLDPYLRDLKCGKAAKGDTCRILTEFAEAKRWVFNKPAGEARWVGSAFVREKGVEKKQLLILWAKRMPTAQVGPGDLPIKVGTGTLDSELVEHGFKMVRSLSQGDQPSKHNQARSKVEEFVPTIQRGAVATSGASVRLIAEDTVYLRQLDRKVLMFAPNLSSSATAGDGTYAEFWVSTW